MGEESAFRPECTALAVWEPDDDVHARTAWGRTVPGGRHPCGGNLWAVLGLGSVLLTGNAPRMHRPIASSEIPGPGPGPGDRDDGLRQSGGAVWFRTLTADRGRGVRPDRGRQADAGQVRVLMVVTALSPDSGVRNPALYSAVGMKQHPASVGQFRR